VIGPPLWSSGQRSGFDSLRCQIFWEVMGLEWGPFSLVSTTEDLLEIKSSGSGLESREYGRKDPSRWPRGTLYPQKLALTPPTSGGRSVGMIRSGTQATEFVSVFICDLRFSLLWIWESVLSRMWHCVVLETLRGFERTCNLHLIRWIPSYTTLLFPTQWKYIMAFST
jgi:hypothetical protein